ncbi:MAG TPA: hypothetical protein PKA53_10665, partial [Sphingobacterium sp.]|nr:hypothetical protein [Sphingobacterium sp.]
PQSLAVGAAKAAIAVEYGLALVLLMPLSRVQIWGWRGILLLMAVYSYYIYHVQHHAPFTPCSCKGVSETLSWDQHQLLTLGLILLALVVMGIYHREWIRQKANFIILKFKQMKKIFSIILPLLFLSVGIALAFNVQDDPICSADGHTGYDWQGPEETPPANFDPEASSLPTGLVEVGVYLDDFECEEDEEKMCHWAFIPAANPNEDGRWVQCEGEYIPVN